VGAQSSSVWRTLAAASLLVLAAGPSAYAVPRMLGPFVGASVPGNMEGIAASPDGTHLYVLGGGLTVNVLAPDPMSGELHLVALQGLPVGGFVSFPDARDLAVSPDGGHVYVAVTHQFNALLAVFSRNAATGLLTFVETKENNVGGVTGLAQVSSVAISPDGAHVYATGNGENAVAVFSRNASTGALTFVEVQRDGVGGVDGLFRVASVGISPDGAHVYAAGQFENEVAMFARNAGTGALTFLGTVSTPNPVSMAVSPDGAHVYVCGGVAAQLSVFARNGGTGALTFVESHVDGAGGITGLGCSEVAVSGDGSHVYATGEPSTALSVALVVFARNGITGALTLVEEESVRFGANRVAVAPDGDHVYATGSYLLSYSRDGGTGALTFADVVSGTDFTNDVAASPDGGHVYWAGRSVVALARDPGTEVLTYASAEVDDISPAHHIREASGVVVSPDSAHVYVSSETDDAATAFARDAGTGGLTLLEAERDGVGGVDGLDGASEIAMSPDGVHVYVTGEDTVAVFARDAGTGLLDFVEVERQGVGGVDGLSGARAVLVSPDGAHVYVMGEQSDAVAVFSRGAGTGALTFVEAKRDGVDGIEDLEEPTGIGISPDGAYVYVASHDDFAGAVSVFHRNPVTGVLTLLEVQREGELGVDGLDATRGIFVSDEAVVANNATFARDPGSGRLVFVHEGGFFFHQLGNAGKAVQSADGAHVHTLFGSVLPGFAGCESGPLPACHPAGGGVLRLSQAGNLVRWRWKTAAPLDISEFGSPFSENFALCIWDDTTQTLLFRALVPGGETFDPGTAGWRGLGLGAANGYSYRDRSRTPEGILNIRMKPGAAGKGRIVLDGGKEFSNLPPLPLPVPVRVQLEGETGRCFEGVYSSPAINDDSGFIAPAD
jgi:6-phosphogluconolactonase (cycloisomerase 2 family)